MVAGKFFNFEVDYNAGNSPVRAQIDLKNPMRWGVLLKVSDC